MHSLIRLGVKGQHKTCWTSEWFRKCHHMQIWQSNKRCPWDATNRQNFAFWRRIRNISFSNSAPSQQLMKTNRLLHITTVEVSNWQEIKEMVISFLTIVPFIPLADLSCQNELLVWQHSSFPEPVAECSQTEPSRHSLTQSNDYYYDDNFIPSSQKNESEISGLRDVCRTFLLLLLLLVPLWVYDVSGLAGHNVNNRVPPKT